MKATKNALVKKIEKETGLQLEKSFDGRMIFVYRGGYCQGFFFNNDVPTRFCGRDAFIECKHSDLF